MADVLNRTINIDGFNRAITDGKSFKKVIRDLNTEILGVEKGTKKYNELQGALVSLKSRQSEVRRETKELTATYIASGKAGVGAYRRLSVAQSRAKSIAKDLAIQQAQGIKLTQAQQQNLLRLNAEIKRQGDLLSKVNKTYSSSRKGLAGFGSIAARVFGVGGALYLAQDVIRNVARAIVDFDKQLIAVGKTTNLEGKKLEGYAQSVIRVGAAQKGISIKGLLESSEIAGQLGIRGRDNLLAFSEVIEKLKLTSNITGEDSAREFAQFIKLSGDSVKNADRLGSGLTALGNNFETTEKQILSNTNEISKGTAAYETSSTGLLALGAATSALGIPAEQGRSAFQSLFKQIDNGVSTGENLENILKVLNISQEELSQQWEQDSTQVIKRFVNGLSDIRENGGNVGQALDQLNIKEKRASLVVATLAKNVDTLNRAFDTSEEAYKSNTALTREYEAATKSVASIYGDFTDSLSGAVLAIDSGNGALSRSAKAVLSSLTGLVNKFTELNTLKVSDNLREQQIEFTALTEALIKNNDNQDVRKGLIEKIQSQYPEYIKNIDLEKASTDDLRKNLRGVNEEFVKRIALQQQEEQLGDLTRDSLSLINEEIRLETELQEAKERGVTLDRVSNTGRGITSITQITEDLERNKRAQEENTQATDAFRAAQEALLEKLGLTSEEAKEITDSEDGLKDKTDEVTTSVTKLGDETQKAAEGSLTDLKSQLSELNKEITDGNLEDNVLKKKIEEIASLESKISDLTIKIERLRTASEQTIGDGAAAADVPEALPSIDIDTEVERTKGVEQAKKEIALQFTKEQEEERLDIIRQRQADELVLETAHIESIKAIAAASLDIVKNLVSESASESIDRINLERDTRLNSIDEEYERRKIAAGDNSAEIQRIEKQQIAAKLKEQKRAEKEEKKIQKRAFLANQLIAAAETIINFRVAEAKALATLGPIGGAAAIAALKIQEVTSLGIIAGQTIVGLIAKDGASIDSNGTLQGASHTNGGIDMVVNGQRVNAEGGESVQQYENGGVGIIKKESTSRNKRLLKYLNGKVFPGKKNLLSKINKSGGGIPFAKDGISVSKQIARVGASIRPRLQFTSPEQKQAATLSASMSIDVKDAIKEGFREMTPTLANEIGDRIESSSERGTMRGSNTGVAQGIENRNNDLINQALLREEESI